MEQIDLSVLDSVLDRYLAHLSETRKDEIYKWEAVKHFKETYNPDVDDFSAMLTDAYQVAGKNKLNLAFGASWFPIGMLDWFSQADRKGTLAALDALYDEGADLRSRMVAFESWAKGMLDRINADQVAAGNDPAKNHYQDTRSMSLYLAFMHPESHYLYKTTMYTEVAKFLGIKWPGNKFDKVIAYREMCEQILAYLKETRSDVIEASDATLGELVEYDPAYHMLVQDIVYYIASYDEDYREEDEDRLTLPYEETKGEDERGQELEALSDESEPKGHWLLVANAKIWSFSELEVGARTSYTIYNDKGNPRRIHKNYLSAKPGDPIIGYESTPARRIVAFCEITKEHDDERLYFHKTRDIEGGLTFDQIKGDPVLSKCEFSRNPNGSFFALTEEEYARFIQLLGLEGEAEDEDAISPVATVEEDSKASAYTDEKFLSEVFVSEDDLADMKELLKRKKNLILQGSPGTGKTFCAKRLAWTMMGCEDDSRITFVQFHQSTTYDDFVCGYRPDGNGGFQVKEGPFVRACRKAAQDPSRPYFVIIDEINRANISKVLGELLMLIEAGHRRETALITVSNKELSVPDNLYIIGMMNTADRGLALIDYALRRRFVFFDMVPALEHPLFLEKLKERDDPRMVALVDATKKVNEDIAADAALGEGFRIGHSYFCDEATDARLVLRYELAPLVKEYWFDDPKKMRQELDKLEQALQ